MDDGDGNSVDYMVVYFDVISEFLLFCRHLMSASDSENKKTDTN